MGNSSRKKPNEVFVGRWREDVIQGETTVRVDRSMVLGTVAELKTETNRSAFARSDSRPNQFLRLSAEQVLTLEKFADVWETQVLTHQKPSSVKAAKSHLKTYIRKHLGKFFSTNSRRKSSKTS